MAHYTTVICLTFLAKFMIKARLPTPLQKVMDLSVEKRRIRKSAVDESEAHEKDVPREFRIFDKKKVSWTLFLRI